MSKKKAKAFPDTIYVHREECEDEPYLVANEDPEYSDDGPVAVYQLTSTKNKSTRTELK